MKVSLPDILRKNEKELEQEKQRVEQEILDIDESNTYQKDNHVLQESEFESRVEDTEIRESNDSLRKSLLDYLSQVKSALSLIRKKKYGICERCGKPIAPERLAVNPSATYCLHCAALLEKANEEA